MIVSLQFVRERFAPNNRTPADLEQNNHYLGLDFLRGVAAFGVVWYHCSARLDLPFLFQRGYLAVDFFFVLSGFVLARAYYARIITGRLPILQFAMMRAIRLMPLIIIGTLTAAVIEIGRPGIADQHQHLIDTMQALLFGSILLPMLWPTTLEHVIFPLNGPTWSLFLEAIANAAFALWAVTRLGFWVLVPLLGISAVSLLFGFYHFGKLDIGSRPDELYLGFSRVSWSFIAGLILFRIRNYAPHIPFIITFCILVSIMMLPVLGELDGLIDLISVFFILPWIVWAASSARFGTLGRRWSAWSGDISYPIYALHYPIVRFFGVVAVKLHLLLIGRLGILVLLTFVILLISAAAYTFFDVPIRKWLTSKFISPSVRRDTRGTLT